MDDLDASTRAAEAATQLIGWARARFGPDLDLDGPVSTSGAGFDSEIVFLGLAGGDVPPSWRSPLVLRIKPDVASAEVARREYGIQNWCADRGLPVPRILQVLEPGDPFDRPAQVMERAPGTIVLDEFRSRPWAFRPLMRELAVLHARVHSVDPTGFPPGEDLLDRRVALPRAMAEMLDHDGLRRGVADVEQLAPRLRSGEASVCHGDFHPLNVLTGPAGPHLIDWTDAGTGDRHGDVARTLALFSVAWIASTVPAERAALRVIGPMMARAYRRSYRRILPLDSTRVALWTPVHLLHGWSQALGATHGAFAATDPGGTAEGRVPSSLASVLERRFGSALDAIR